MPGMPTIPMSSDLSTNSTPSANHAALAHTVKHGLVSPVFQPIVDLQTGRVAGYEALCRPSPDSQFRNAEEMFTAAEGDPLSWQLESLAREKALAAAQGWPAGVLLFLNSSPEVVSDERFAAQVTRQVRSTGGLHPSRIVLEITERCKEQEFGGLSRTLDLLRDTGFHIAIDDVGAGTSGLNRITSLKPGWLKLDRELIDHIDQDKVRQHLIRFLVYFGKLSSIRIIAEGIERVEELDAVIDLGVNFGQGYLLAKPGERDQTISEELVEHIREKGSQHSSTGHAMTPRAGTLARIARIVSSTDSIRTVADIVLHDLYQLGVIVSDGDTFVGWVDRDVVLRAASDGRADLSISFLMSVHSSPVDADMPIVEMLDLASTRSEHAMASPIVVLDAGKIVGIISMPDLLQAGASLCRATQFRHAPLTGLPGRVRTDQYLRELMSREDAEFDVAFIDIKGFAGYNQAVGYELGDQLIQSLVRLIRSTLAPLGDDAFAYIGHLGDDQFVVTAPSEFLGGQISELVKDFEQLLLNSDEACGNIGIRIMLLTQVSGDFGDAAGLFVARSTLRTELDLRLKTTRVSRSDVIAKSATEILGIGPAQVRRSA